MHRKKVTYKIDCIHKIELVNQCVTMCSAGHVPDCDACTFKESRGQEVIMSYTSTNY